MSSPEDLQPDGTGFTPYAERNTPPPWARCAYCGGERWVRPEVGAVESWVQWRMEHEHLHPQAPPAKISPYRAPKPKGRALRMAAAIPLYVVGGILFAAGIVGGLFTWIGTFVRLMNADEGFWAFLALVMPPADLVLAFYVGLGGLLIASVVAHLLGRVIFGLGALVMGE